jgi:hypothetical protein
MYMSNIQGDTYNTAVVTFEIEFVELFYINQETNF